MVIAADQAGIDELWLWEDCFLEGGLTSAAAALAWSTRLRVGVGLLPVPLRNPALVAMELATIARLWPGRFVGALGHGVQEWMRQVGAGAESPMTLLREHTSAVRALLDGETVDVAGRYVQLDKVTLDWPPPRRPALLLGARGPKTIRLAGEVADGVLLDSITDADVVRRARRLVAEGRDESGRGGAPIVGAYTQVDPSSDAAGLRARIEDHVSELADAGADAVIVQATSENPDPRPLIEALAEGE